MRNSYKEIIISNLPKQKIFIHLPLFVISIFIFCTAIWAYLQNYTSYWLYLLLQSFVLFFWMICSHEAIHRATHKNHKINELIGYSSHFLLFSSYKTHRRQHLIHHAKPATEGDPEHLSVPKGGSVLKWIFYGLTPLIRVNLEALKHSSERATMIFVHLLLLGFLLFFQESFLLLYVAPYSIAKFVFWYAATGAAHAIFKVDEKPWKFISNELTQFLTFYHEEHHLFPHYSFYQWPSLYFARRRYMMNLPKKERVKMERELNLIPF